MSTFISPGVYIQERDDSLYTPGASPAIFGIIGTSTQGTEDEATLVTSQGQLTSLFGRPRTKDYGMHAAIEALKVANIVYFVRISGSNASKGFVTVQDTGSGALPASILASNVSPYNLISGTSEATLGTRTGSLEFTYDDGAGSNTDIASFSFVAAQITAQNAVSVMNFDGIGGNPSLPATLTVVVDGGTAQTITFAATDFVDIANPTISELLAVLNSQLQGASARDNSGSILLQSDKYGTSSSIEVTGGTANAAMGGFDFAAGAQSGSGDAADLEAVTISELNIVIAADTTTLNVVDPGGADAGKAKLQTSTTGATRNVQVNNNSNTTLAGAAPLVNWALGVQSNGANSGSAADTATFTARTNGSHSSRISVRVLASSVLAGSVRVQILLDGIVAETFDNLAMGPNAPAGSNDLADIINDGITGTVSASSLVTVTDLNPTTAGNPIVGTHTLSAGDNGDNWTASDVIGTITSSIRTGMQVFEDPEQIFINVLSTPGISYSSVIAAGITLCESRSDCLYIVDAPKSLTPAEVVQWHNGDSSITAIVDQENRTENNSTVFNSSYAALYYPFVKINDPFNRVDAFFPPSSVIMRTLAYTDQISDPWFAPAGPNRTRASSVIDLEFNPSQGERDVMQISGNNVNPIISKSGVGTIVMGQKTLQRAPTSLDKVNVRRLLLSLKKTIATATFFLLFEPNDATLWRRFVNLVEPLLRDVKARRGLEDFRVICDSSTTTPLLRDQGTMLGKIFLDPIEAAERIVIEFNLTPSGTDFSEFVIQ